MATKQDKGIFGKLFNTGFNKGFFKGSKRNTGKAEHGRNTSLKTSFAVENLEDRRLMAWSPISQLIDLDQAISRYPQYNGAGQTIANLDTGVNANHPSLAGKLFRNNGEIAGNGRDDDGNGKVDDTSGWDFVSNDNNPADTQGHGTMTAGNMVSGRYVNTGNSRTRGDYKEYQGVASGAKVLSLRVASGTAVSVYTTEKALQYVIANKSRFNISAVNMSLGFPSHEKPVIADELQKLNSMGVFIGYGGASFTAATGQVDANGNLTSKTYRGVDILAPGKSVPYLDLGRGYGLGGDASSYATPFVTAAGAVIKQVNSGFSPSQILSILLDSGQSVYDGSSRKWFKRIDMDGAISLALQRSGKPASSGVASPAPLPVTSPTTTTAKRSARSTIQAESYNAQKGITRAPKHIGYVDSGDWVKYDDLDFGSGVNYFQANVGVTSAYAGRTIQIRLDSATGKIVGQLKVNSTGGWDIYRAQTTKLWTKVTGVHDMYLTFSGGSGVGNIDWFKFW